MMKAGWRPLSITLLAVHLSCLVIMAQAAGSSGRSSAAYAEVLLRRTELAAEVESVSPDYTDENPKLIDLRYEVAGLDRYLKKMLALNGADTEKLTQALGKLIVKRMGLDVELVRLSRTLKPDHSDYKRAKRRLEIFDSAIKDMFP